ncbi:MAG: hypothetical protein WCP50_07150 [Actinomycetota bacterium]
MVYLENMTEGAQQNLRMRWAAYASIGAGVLHGAAVGLHADHATLSRIFMALTVAQVCWGVIAISRSQWSVVLAGFAINGTAAVGWIMTRTSGISFVDGLEIAEKPQLADTLCALLAVVAIGASLWAWRQRDVPIKETSHLNAVYLTSAITLVALWSVTGHAHAHAHVEDIALTDSGLSINADGVIVSPSTIAPIEITTSTSTVPASSNTAGSVATKKKTVAAAPTSIAIQTTVVNTTTTTIHSHSLTSAQALAAASGWPRPYDPAVPIDFSGIGGVTSEQAARATTLIQSAQRDLPKYAKTSTATADGYVSIGDGLTGFEHFIKYSLLSDGRVLDTAAPESLVYEVKGGVKTLVSAMFIANPGTPLTDTTLVNYAGGLMQWHVHTNLCWITVNGVPKVVGVTNAAGACVIGTLQTGGAPMVHVWIAPHVCGPFAALEGNGAGVADASDAERVDLCNKAH